MSDKKDRVLLVTTLSFLGLSTATFDGEFGLFALNVLAFALSGGLWIARAK